METKVANPIRLFNEALSDVRCMRSKDRLVF